MTYQIGQTIPAPTPLRKLQAGQMQAMRGVAKHLRDDRIAERIEAAIVEAWAGLELLL